MIFAVISDVHANLEAVETCFREIDRIKPDRIICLGDMVDYCAQPNEVMDILRLRCDVIIMGNHDEAQVDYSLSDGFSESARISSILTRSVLKQEHKDFISTLHLIHSEEGLLFVHASPLNPHEYDYILNEADASANFTAFKESVCFIGHSHRPLVFLDESKGAKKVEQGSVKKGHKYIINSGSVGQPRDGDPRLAFGVFDSEKFEYRLIRLDYNIKSASDKIRKLGLPERLAEKLSKGL